MKIKKIMTRIYANDINQAIDFYEKLLGEKCSMQFKYQELGLELASINSFLIIAGTDESLAKLKSTSATILVDSVSEYKEFLLRNQAEIIKDIQKVPTGFNMTMKHKDGIIIEYVEHL
jgi:predicted enzyme related to lactoylglutathione lyase